MKRIKKFRKIEDIKNKINEKITKNYNEEINRDINNEKLKEERLESLLNSQIYQKINVYSFGKFDHEKIIENIINGLIKRKNKYLLKAEDKAITKSIFMLEIIKKKMENYDFYH